MGDEEYERFEITDYDLENEFNPNRFRKKQSKQQAIYGIWADDSDKDDDDDEDNSSGRNRKGRRRMGLGGGSSGGRSKDYTAPVSFVAGGIQQAGKKNKSKKSADDDERNSDDAENPITDEEDELNSHPGFGAGQRPTLMDAESPHTSEDSEEEEQERRMPPPSKASGFKQQQTGHLKVGAWEQHTRGIGAKLLLQMGYKPGMGLGKDLQGISQPVEAHVRKGRGAIGAYGPETAASVGGKGHVPKIDEDVREAKEFKEKLNKWKKSGTECRSDKNSKRYYYKSVEEVLEKGKSSNFIIGDKISKKLGNVPVIDMTGPEKRVLSGYHAIGQTKVVDEDLYDSVVQETQPKKSTATFALPELMHNLSLIVNMCEQDIITLDTAQNNASERCTALEQEKKQLEEIVSLERNHINTLDHVLSMVDELTAGGEDLRLSRAEEIFLELQQNYAAEYKQFGLDDLAAGVIAPLLKQHLADWKPLESPTQYVDVIKKWRTILEVHNEDTTEKRSNIFDPYSSLIWAGVIPSFRSCAEFWDPKQHQSMAALLDCWAPLFPSWILDSVLEQLVLPRLSAGVKQWDPLTDTVPIHIWILPWNAILGHKMEEFIYPTIREKLGNALRAWLPQDRSARAMLTPWKGAFDEHQMQLFLLTHIIPKLQMVLNEFIINPLQQDLEPWNQVYEWHELIPPGQMAQLLDKFFFPKWMQVLVMWLNQSPDYVEISRWYSGWKSMFSEDLLREASIKEHLRRALEMMHRATDQVPHIPGQATNQPNMATNTPPPPQPPPPPSILLNMDMSSAAAPVQLEFKELVSRKCAERGILFAPLPGRRELGKQVYRVGKLYCYIDRNVCMITDSSFKNWIPTPLQPMLERAVTGILN
ncbi:septin-interacting protein 1 [Musca vetustissima]|uniref:septin-interacting protein 1 n=1 Tax=Musca vetustissima TaxID=27455 RepID=UPI002AB60BFD|nr:septin-interacting protein 1 [Musca vetustissima]